MIEYFKNLWKEIVELFTMKPDQWAETIEEHGLNEYREHVYDMAHHRLNIFVHAHDIYTEESWSNHHLPTQKCIEKHFGPGDFRDHVTKVFNEILRERYSPEEILLMKLKRPDSPIAKKIVDIPQI